MALPSVDSRAPVRSSVVMVRPGQELPHLPGDEFEHGSQAHGATLPGRWSRSSPAAERFDQRVRRGGERPAPLGERVEVIVPGPAALDDAGCAEEREMVRA
jgi:hypothetical protein